jgi:hypothetical protein
VVAASQNVDAKRQQVFRKGRRDAETAGGIFTVGDYQIDLVGADDVLEVIGHNAAAWRGENIADKEKVH